MLNFVFNFWNLFFIVTLIFSIYFYFYIKYIGNFYDVLFKIVYFIISWVVLFIYFFINVDFIFKNFLRKINDIIIIKDVQDMVNISLDVAFLFSIYFIIPLCLIYLYLYIFVYKNINENFVNKNILIIFLYYYLLLKYFLDSDLFVASWKFFNESTLNFNAYDFQPDLLFLIKTYMGDFNDLLFYFCLVIFFLFIHLYSLYQFKNIFFNKNFYKVKFCFEILLGIFFFYFFGGENIFKDFFLIAFSVFLCELYFFSFLFFFYLKHKKI